MQLSIIIPLYNGKKYLKECLESIIRELEDERVEIIVVNDGSTEEVDDIIELYKNHNIKYFKKSHQGVSVARNFGIEASSGKWIMFVDADDYLKKFWYQKVSKYFESTSDGVYFSPIKSNNKEALINSIIGLNNDNAFLITSASKLYRREFIINNGIQFKRGVINGEDQLFNLEFIIKAKKYELVNESIYFYRPNLESSTHTFKEEIFSSCEIYLKELNRILNEHSISKKELYLKCCLKGILCTLINRISLLNLKQQRKYLSYIKYDKNIKDYIQEINIPKINTKQDLIIYLLKKNLYFTAVLMFTGKRKIKKLSSLVAVINEENATSNVDDRDILKEEKRQYLRKKFELLIEIQKRKIKGKMKFKDNSIQNDLNISKLLLRIKKSDIINNKKE